MPHAGSMDKAMLVWTIKMSVTRDYPKRYVEKQIDGGIDWPHAACHALCKKSARTNIIRLSSGVIFLLAAPTRIGRYAGLVFKSCNGDGITGRDEKRPW